MENCSRKIKFEPFIGRYFGISKFIDKNGILTEVDGETIANNWGEIICDIVLPENYNMISPTYTKNGQKILTYQDASYRYYIIYSSIINSIVLKKIEKNNRYVWVLSDKDEKKNILDSLNNIEIRKSSNEINEIINKNGFISFPEDIGGEYIRLMDNYDIFKDTGWEAFVELFDILTARLKIPIDKRGYNFPEYIQYQDVKYFLKKLKFLKTSNIDGDNELYESYGGDNLLRFLSERENIFSKSIEKVNNYEYIIPTINVSLSLNRKTEENGLFSESDDAFLNDNVHLSGVKNISIGESKLGAFKEIKTYQDDDGIPINGILKSSKNDGTKMMLRKNSSSGIWEEVDGEISGDYNKIPVFSSLNFIINKDIPALVLYRNGGEYTAINYKPNNFIFKGVNSEKYTSADGVTERFIKDTNDNNILTLNKNVIYHLLKNVFNNDSEMIFKKNDYIIFNDLVEKWNIFDYENIAKCHTPKKYERVSIDGKLTIFPENDDYEYIFISGRYYIRNIVYADVPYVVNKPFNEKYGEDGNLISFDYIKEIKMEKDYLKTIYFKYIENAVGNINIDGTINENTENNSRIVYEDEYEYSLAKSDEALIGGYKIKYYFYDINYEKSTITFIDKDNYIDRGKPLSRITHYVGTGESDSYYVFKNEWLNGISIANKPEINVTFNRGNASAFEKYMKLMECNTFEDLKNYGNDYFGIRNEKYL